MQKTRADMRFFLNSANGITKTKPNIHNYVYYTN